MASIRIIADKCAGCKQCLSACPFAAIGLDGRASQKPKAVILDNCTLCGACVDSCKFAAIELTKDEAPRAEDISSYSGVWVYCEQFNGNLRPVSLELIGEGRRIADELGVTLSAALIGHNMSDNARKLIACGADRVILADDKSLHTPHDLAYTDILERLILKYLPSIVLLGATSFGRSLAPRVAARLKTGLTADCTSLETDAVNGLLLQTRPAFGGNIMATIVCPNNRPQMATVRPKTFAMPEACPSRKGEIITERIPANGSTPVEIVKLLKNEGGAFNIGDADILVAVGKGIGAAGNIILAEELANLLGGALAVSRPLVDNALCGYSHQVGQTGKTVAPKVYIACGISGAVQHMAGVAAETIIAVNSDPDAPIFNYAHYAVNADCVEFLQSMIELIKSKNYRPFSSV